MLGRPVDHILVERFEQHEMLLHACRNTGRTQLVEEVEKHRIAMPVLYVNGKTVRG